MGAPDPVGEGPPGDPMKSPVRGDRTLDLRNWGEVLALGFMGAIGLLLAVNYPSFYSNAKDPLFDAKAYWLAGQEGWIPYSLPPGALNAYLYSPAFQQVISLVSWLPWPAFAILWVSAEAAVFVWLLKPLGWAWGIVLFLWCIPELYIGNIYAFLAAAAVLALTGFPQAWALPILTSRHLSWASSGTPSGESGAAS